MPSIAKNVTYNLAKLLSYSLKFLTEEEIINNAKLLVNNNKGKKSINHLDIFCKGFDREFSGIENKILLNGESWLIEKMADLNFKTIFDVGANVGNWSKLAYKSHTDAKVHAFEIVPETFDILKDNLSDKNDRIIFNNFGMSDSNGSIQVYTNPLNSVLSSTLDFENTGTKKIDCQIKAGKTYCLENNIESIDFLKIDVEGAEYKVLKGFEELLKAGKIRIIQFEYNQGAILSKFLLRDFYQYFEQLGYKLGRLFPDRVAFKDYSFNDEDFKGPNYIAIKRGDELSKLIEG